VKAAGCAIAGLAALLAAAEGCSTTRLQPEELPSAPIAIQYRTVEEARRYADDWQRQQEAQGASARTAASGSASGELVPHVDQLRDLMTQVLGVAEQGGVQHAGRLALLDPSSGDVEVVRAALRGAVPLDWGSEGRRLLFAQPEGRNYQLWELDREHGTVRPLTHGRLSHPQGCYGPEGRIVAVELTLRDDSQTSRIVISEPGGRRPFRPLSRGPWDHSPACAPDASALVFVRDTASGRGQLIGLAPPLGSPERVVAPGRDPVFSPDGEWIVYSAMAGRIWRLWRVRRDGTGRSPLGRGLRSEAAPTVSPDGSLVAYVASEALPSRHLYVRRFDGTGDRILFADGDGEFPVW
jgi:Tol biopolymer transport system component